jgi:hypothetical protein
MRRLHLWEIHEQPWCPSLVRDGATDCLAAIGGTLHQYRNVVPLLQRMLAATGSRQIVDLCSGGAGPWLRMAPQLQRRLHRPVPIALTDLYPSWHSQARPSRRGDGRQNGEAAGTAEGKVGKKAGGSGFAPAAGGAGGSAQIVFVPFPVDATQVSPALPGLRTLFTAFHHFEASTAQAILQSAVDAGEGIGIFEQTRRSPLALLVMLILPLLAWLFTPFLRPFRWSRLFWTYVVPAIPFVLLHDGIVSCLRTYEPAELQAMVARLHGRPYVWEIGRTASPLSPIGITYLTGWPSPPAPPVRPPQGSETAPNCATMD